MVNYFELIPKLTPFLPYFQFATNFYTNKKRLRKKTGTEINGGFLLPSIVPVPDT